MSDNERNWAGNLEFSTNSVYYPATIAEVQSLVGRFPKLRVLGSRHSFNRIADSDQNLVSLNELQRVVELDRDSATLIVSAGVKYGDICQYLSDAGFALHNLASLPHISVAGACATATHGSGVGNGNLATAVTSLQMVTAAGDLLTLSRAQHGDTFNGMVVGLGGLGVITQMTLELVPAFEIQQVVYQNLPLTKLVENFDRIMSAAYSVSLFTDWQGDGVAKVWLKHKVTTGADREWPDEYFGATRATVDLHPIPDHSAESCTPQMGVAGPWQDRLPHFRMEFTPSSGKELQSEYFVACEHGPSALMAIRQLGPTLAPFLMVSEIRTIAADDLWLSPCYHQDCVAFHFTWQQDWPGVREVLPLIEAALAPFNPRPHWGKLFTMPPEQVQASYERLPDFRKLLHEFDSAGKFRNEFLDTYIFEPHR